MKGNLRLRKAPTIKAIQKEELPESLNHTSMLDPVVLQPEESGRQ